MLTPRILSLFRYIPYIANEILFNHSKKENKANGLNYQGLAINDPSWVSDLVGEQLPVVEFAEHYQKILQINDSTIASLRKTAKANGVDNFIAKNLVYPPKGPIELPKKLNVNKYDAFDVVYSAAVDANPCFNIYNIDPIYHCPDVTDPLGYPPEVELPSSINIINNITGFKQYIHADPSTVWFECTNYNVS